MCATFWLENQLTRVNARQVHVVCTQLKTLSSLLKQELFIFIVAFVNGKAVFKYADGAVHHECCLVRNDHVKKTIYYEFLHQSKNILYLAINM